MEDLNIRRRNKLRHHFTTTSNVLLFGYPKLSDGAKVTYQVIDSFDWADSVGLRKGFAYPSLGRLAKIRGLDERTIRRHLVELERARLITRQERPGRPNLLIIEDASELETFKYLREFAGGVGEDKNVLPAPDKNVRPLLKKDEEREEKQNSLTRVKNPLGEEREGGHPNGETRFPEHIANTLRGRLAKIKPRAKPIPEWRAKRDYLAAVMACALGDNHSRLFYRRVTIYLTQR